MTLIPAFELRASIPYGIIVLGMNWPLVFVICVVTNWILGPLVYAFWDKIIFLVTKIKFVDKIYTVYVEKTQKKIQKYVDRFGTLGVSVFIGIPLPGSGSYSGAIGAHLIGLRFKKFVIANIIGVLIAGIAVTAIVLSGSSIFGVI